MNRVDIPNYIILALDNGDGKRSLSPAQVHEQLEMLIEDNLLIENVHGEMCIPQKIIYPDVDPYLVAAVASKNEVSGKWEAGEERLEIGGIGILTLIAQGYHALWSEREPDTPRRREEQTNNRGIETLLSKEGQPITEDEFYLQVIPWGKEQLDKGTNPLRVVGAITGLVVEWDMGHTKGIDTISAVRGNEANLTLIVDRKFSLVKPAEYVTLTIKPE